MRDSKRLTYYICTSAVNRCDKPRKGSPMMDLFSSKEEGSVNERQQGRKKLKYPEKIVTPEEKKSAKNSLNALLESLTVESGQKQEDDTHVEDMLKVQIVRKQSKKQNKIDLGALIYEAADSVARDLGGDTKKTKEDLLQHLRTIEIKEESLEFIYINGINAVAKTEDWAIVGPSTTYPTKVRVEEVNNDPLAEPDAPEKVPPFEKSEFRVSVGNTLRALEDVFSSERLGIFDEKNAREMGNEVKLNIWESLEEEELAYLMKKPPKNQLEEWILWTEQGKLWQFPIDNDQGMEREAKVEFTQHVFLEEHLEPWCLKKGPLKKFMDLVLVGLSKNPYLTVEDKKEHIFWYRDYFEKKKKLLQELGAFGPAKEIGESVNPSPEKKL